MRSQFLMLTLYGSLITCAGCGSNLGEKAEFDSLVDEVWLDFNAGELRNAAEYLQAGGTHYDIVPGTTVDQDYVIPLCKQLASDFNVECQALLYDDDSAGQFTTEILVALPGNPNDRNGIASVLEDIDKAFPGKIIQTWGNKWLAFSFVDADSVE